MAIEPIRQALPHYTSGYLYFAWVIPGSLFVVVVAGMYFRFLIHLPMRTRRQFLLAGALYVGGALGIELLEGQYAARHGMENFTAAMVVAAEEGLEMVGIVIFLYALSSYIASHAGQVRIALRSDFPPTNSPRH